MELIVLFVLLFQMCKHLTLVGKVVDTDFFFICAWHIGTIVLVFAHVIILLRLSRSRKTPSIVLSKNNSYIREFQLERI